jgi:hypothetical protein
MSPVVISASVGAGCVNKAVDVKKIQLALNAIAPHWGGANPKLDEDGDCKYFTKTAIANLQQWQFGWNDSQISPGGVTLKRINEMLASPEKPGNPDTIKVKWEFSYPFVGQIKAMGCWAATGAMLISARDCKQYTLEEGLVKADDGTTGFFHSMFDLDTGLRWDYHPKYTKALGLKLETNKTFPIATMVKWVKDGPVGLTLIFSNRTHIVAVTGMRGDGTLYGTYGVGYDPMGKTFVYSWRTLKGQYDVVGYQSIWRR